MILPTALILTVILVAIFPIKLRVRDWVTNIVRFFAIIISYYIVPWLAENGLAIVGGILERLRPDFKVPDWLLLVFKLFFFLLITAVAYGVFRPRRPSGPPGKPLPKIPFGEVIFNIVVTTATGIAFWGYIFSMIGTVNLSILKDFKIQTPKIDSNQVSFEQSVGFLLQSVPQSLPLIIAVAFLVFIFFVRPPTVTREKVRSGVILLGLIVITILVLFGTNLLKKA